LRTRVPSPSEVSPPSPPRVVMMSSRTILFS
jgi:hypothetical protein